MSTNRTKGYKKIKTVKSGKTITVSSFKKKSFKKYKDYYYYISSAKKQIGEFVLEEFLNMSVFIYLLYGLQM